MDSLISLCTAIAQRHAEGALSAQVALMEMLIATEDEHVVERVLAQLAHAASADSFRELAQVFAQNREGCSKIASILRAEQTAGEARSVAESLTFCRQLFDTLVQESEETSVALYSLGNPEILAAATAEIVAVLRQHQLLGAAVRVLDVGCGIGRMAVALSPHVGQLHGIDLSAQMVAVATRRCAKLGNVRISACSGADFAGFAAGSMDLVLAVDSFPYVVQAGAALVHAIFAEAARVLVPGGHFVLLNFSYGGDLAGDSAQVSELAKRHGFTPSVLAEQPFSLWNGALFSLRRA
ncbi:MAG: Methyltransferase type 11 [Myxococcaceae bacterium]|nr:Methyltransferase type 11 [Myxococcaceae bacterium]